MTEYVVQNHEARTDNPHAVTKSQVGLGSVLNVEQKNMANIWRRDYNLSLTPNSMSSGAWTYGGTYGFSTAGASSAAYNNVWYLDIEPGTWTFEIWCTSTSNSGIITFEYSLDNSNWVTLAANVDHYSAANAIKITTVTGIVIASQTRLYFRNRSAGTKNASSAAYYNLISGLFARRTA